MKKKIFSSVLGAAVLLSAQLLTTNALSPPVKGDFNQDWQVNISDVICLQRYLLGVGQLSWGFGVYPYDMNDDKTVDIFDYIELKKQVVSPEDRIETSFTRCAKKSEKGIFAVEPTRRQQLIKSADELEKYFLPTSVMKTSGDCVITQTATEEVIEEFESKYDDDFFAANVLALNYLNGVDSYSAESAQYDGEGNIIIKYYDSSDPNEAVNKPLPPIIAQAVIPKKICADNTEEINIIWEKVDRPASEKTERPFEYTAQSDYTANVTAECIEFAAARGGTPTVLTSSEEFEKFISGKFHKGIELGLKDRYDKKFFEKNNLIIDLNFKADRDFFRTTVTAEMDSTGKIFLNYEYNYIDDLTVTNRGIEIHQIAFPKEFGNVTAERRQKRFDKVESGSYFISDFRSLGITYSNYIKTERTPRWVDSEEELKEYIISHLTEENADIIDTSAFDWEKNSVCVWFSDIVCGTEYSESGVFFDNDMDRLEFSRLVNVSCGDVIDFGISILEVEKSFSGKELYTRNVYVDRNAALYEGTESIFENSRSSFMINQYQFNGRNVADIYQLYPIGLDRYGKFNYIGTIEFEDDYFPIKGGDFYSDEKEGDSVFESDDYTFTISENDITIRYKYSENSEYTEKTFSKKPKY